MGLDFKPGFQRFTEPPTLGPGFYGGEIVTVQERTQVPAFVEVQAGEETIFAIICTQKLENRYQGVGRKNNEA